MSPELTELLIALAAAVLTPLAFIAWWSFICFMLGLLSGWRGLAERYGTTLPAPPRQHHFEGGRVGWVSHRGTLVLGATEDGLDLRVMLLFRPGHPPLRIPWAELVDEGEAFSVFVKMVKIRLGPAGPLLRIRRDTWQALRPGAS